ncbi:U4/U6 x U5 tri-snRNP complex subunit Prp1 [Yamadazyma tenuis]|uniref:TPR-like protein n=1 Tax=Candida tenuis (strain ATCC 10573 / BCRC 21748 / CBS 615 / JCM 9827 / NBRC 10315 / NRRL Y-1498 / VKM Y-70) TaxID=590646 RepID=G3B7L2_CANTC|nr:TPR-like protein [Yamadazyma tenuis ATCC 10573]EGV61643.1 TPR-like protein [Yamadazyma tenuis ATCC 10573]WEJ92867.1 U4/U6 x U5 tri-snRNP complex subunit Prp1 [Yamadazyma tenuis]
MDRKAFLDQEAPAGYVAGVGRGATGFVTSADAGGLRSVRPFEPSDSEDDNGDNNSLGLLGGQSKDDEEADRVYDEVERRLQKRHKNTSQLEVVQQDEENQIAQQFTDLKRHLAHVSQDEWANLPEASDFTKRNKRMRLLEQSRQRFYATPDNIISAQRAGDGNRFTRLETEAQDDLENGIETDLMMADIQKNRTILSSLRKSEPNRSSSWIASARLEVQAKNFSAAKRFIAEGCKRAPHSEDVWLESIKIHQNSTDGIKVSKVIVTEALKYNSGSEKLWLKACECENSADLVSQRRVLMKGIEFIPGSVKLWEKMIELQEDEADVKKMLSKVVELCPSEWNFWLSFINLSPYEEAKNLINRARKAMKNNHQVWITAAKLEERESMSISDVKIMKMLEKGIKTSNEHTEEHQKLTRSQWLDEAARAEKEGFLLTCKAIVFSTISFGISADEPDKLNIYFTEARKYSTDGFHETGNYIYEYITTQYPNDIECWIRFFEAYKSVESFKVEGIYKFYERAISFNNEEEVFPLMYAKDKWKLGDDITGARDILDEALKRLDTKEDIWHAKIKFEIKTGNLETANKISKTMIQTIPKASARVWYKHIHLQRYINKVMEITDYQTYILKLVDEALEWFPEEEKLHLQNGQILLEDLNLVEQAKEAFLVATNKHPEYVDVWISLAKVYEEKLNVIIRARSILDSAITQNPNDDRLWLEKIGLERRNKDLIAARQLCNKALRSFNSSPRVWIEYLTLIPKMSQRKNAFLDALKSTDNSPIILLNIGIFFWVDGKLKKAKSWFDRALDSDPQNGDIWGWLYNFHKQNGSPDEVQQFQKQFAKGGESINRGYVWNKVAKAVESFNKEPIEILELVSSQLKGDTKI